MTDQMPLIQTPQMWLMHHTCWSGASTKSWNDGHHHIACALREAIESSNAPMSVIRNYWTSRYRLEQALVGKSQDSPSIPSPGRTGIRIAFKGWWSWYIGHKSSKRRCRDENWRYRVTLRWLTVCQDWQCHVAFATRATQRIGSHRRQGIALPQTYSTTRYWLEQTLVGNSQDSPSIPLPGTKV